MAARLLPPVKPRLVGGLMGALVLTACERPERVQVFAAAATVPPTTAGPAMVASAPTSEPAPPCPPGMALVEGLACTDVEHECLRWLDPPGSRYAQFRCAEYRRPARCRGPRTPRRFCIDINERTEPGSNLPRHGTSWTQAKVLCEGQGARLCTTREWEFACEGEEMRPYAYGWSRDSTACNVDIGQGLGRVGHLVDHRTPAEAHPRCVSPFGVHDMAGNVDEWTTVEGAPAGSREVMKGSWWMPGRHACRAQQGGHGAHYGGVETGARCCKDTLSALR